MKLRSVPSTMMTCGSKSFGNPKLLNGIGIPKNKGDVTVVVSGGGIYMLYLEEIAANVSHFETSFFGRTQSSTLRVGSLRGMVFWHQRRNVLIVGRSGSCTTRSAMRQTLASLFMLVLSTCPSR